MPGFPFGRDQPEVAGAGIRLPARKLTPARLRTAVHWAIGLRPGAQRIAAAFAAAGGPTTAADVLERLITTRNNDGATACLQPRGRPWPGCGSRAIDGPPRDSPDVSN